MTVNLDEDLGFTERRSGAQRFAICFDVWTKADSVLASMDVRKVSRMHKLSDRLLRVRFGRPGGEAGCEGQVEQEATHEEVSLV